MRKTGKSREGEDCECVGCATIMARRLWLSGKLRMRGGGRDAHRKHLKEKARL